MPAGREAEGEAEGVRIDSALSWMSPQKKHGSTYDLAMGGAFSYALAIKTAPDPDGDRWRYKGQLNIDCWKEYLLKCPKGKLIR